MPHLTVDIEPQGPIAQVAVGVSDAHQRALTAAKLKLPQIQLVRGLIDTGASCSMVDPAVIQPLGLSPTSFGSFHTPSTDGKPVSQPIYDVSIWLYHEDSKYVLRKSFPVGCANLRSTGIDMLIGRDVLGACLLVYDGSERRYSLAF